MPVPLCTPLEALPSSSGRTEYQTSHRSQRVFNVHRYCGVATVRQRRLSTLCQPNCKPAVPDSRRTSKCATQQDAEGGVSSTQAEVTQHGSENSEKSTKTVGNSTNRMDDSDDDENSPSGFVLAGNTEKSGDEVQQILGKCQSAQEFLGAASRCLEAEVIIVLFSLSKTNPQPEVLLSPVLQQLDILVSDGQGIDLELMQNLCYLLTRMNTSINPVTVRKLHEKVICNLPEYSPRDFFGVLCTLSYLRPYLAPGMVTLCWDRALEVVPFADVKAMSSLLRAMVRIQPVSPLRLQSVVFERCMELAPEMSTQCLSRAIFWLYKSKYAGGEQLLKILDNCMLAKLEEATLSNLYQWVTAYVWLRHPKYKSVDVLARKVLTFDRPGPNILGNILQLLAFVKHKDKRLAIEVADRACGRLDECSGPLLVAILKAAVDLQMEHRIIWEIVERVDAKSAEITPKGFIRFITAACAIKNRPRELQPIVAKYVTAEIIEEADMESLVYTIGALGKCGIKDKSAAQVLASAIEGGIASLNASTIMFVMKMIMFMGGNVEKLLKTAKDTLIRDLPHGTAEDLSYAHEAFSLMGQRGIYDKKIMGVVLESCIYNLAEMGPDEISRVARGIGRSRIRDPTFLEGVSAAAEALIPEMSAKQLCWVLWSFAKVEYKFPRDAYSLAANRISENIKELHPHDVTRFLFSAAHNHYADKPVLQRVADFVTSHEPDAFQIAGISIVAWSFCKLQFSHEKFLSWLVENTQEKLPNALPQALANIMLALQTFDFNPGEEYLRAVMDATSNKMTGFRPFEMSMVTQCLAVFNLKLDRTYLDACSSFLEENIQSFDGRSVCHILWTLNENGYRPPEKVAVIASQKVQKNFETIQVKSIGQFLYVVGRSGYRPSTLLEDSVGKVAQHSRRMNPESLSVVIRGFSICQYLSESLVQSVRDASFSKLWDFSPNDLAGLVWGLANLGYREEEFFKRAAICCVDKLDRMDAVDIFTLLWAFARADRPAAMFIEAGFSRLSGGEMKRLNGPQLVSLSWATAKLGVYDAKLLDALAECVEEQYKEFNVKGISTILWAFATLNYDPGSLFRNLASQIGKEGLETIPTWLALTHVLWSCARLQYRPPRSVLTAGMELLQTSQDDIRWKGGMRDTSQQGGVQARHLMLCLWSLAVFGRHRTELVEGLSGRVNNLDILEDMEEEQKQQVAQCILGAQSYEKTSPLIELPEHYLSEAMSSWRNLVKWNAEQEVSLFHKNVATCLLSLRISHKEKMITEDRCMVLDIFVPYSSDSQSEESWKGVALELCGNQHLTANTRRMTGKAVFRQRLLKARGYRVVPILLPDWEEIQLDQGQKEAYLSSRLLEAGVITRAVASREGNGDSGAADVKALQVEDLGAFVDELEDDLEYQEGIVPSGNVGDSAAGVTNPIVNSALS